MTNDVGMKVSKFFRFEKIMKNIKNGEKLNIREISSKGMILENDKFIIEITCKEAQDNDN